MNKKTNRGPGRPKAEINIPNKKFTFADLMAANTHVTPLTLRKFLANDMFVADKNGIPDRTKPRRNSTLILVKGEKRAPAGEKGLGRKTLVYIKRTRLNALSTAKKSSVSVPITDNTPAIVPTPVAETVTAPIAATADIGLAVAPMS